MKKGQNCEKKEPAKNTRFTVSITMQHGWTSHAVLSLTLRRTDTTARVKLARPVGSVRRKQHY